MIGSAQLIPSLRSRQRLRCFSPSLLCTWRNFVDRCFDMMGLPFPLKTLTCKYAFLLPQGHFSQLGANNMFNLIYPLPVILISVHNISNGYKPAEHVRVLHSHGSFRRRKEIHNGKFTQT